jgi:hypothetical protein
MARTFFGITILTLSSFGVEIHQNSLKIKAIFTFITPARAKSLLSLCFIGYKLISLKITDTGGKVKNMASLI